MYSNKKGAEFCVRCTVGEYSDTTGATKCKLCKKGSIGVKHGASSSDDGCKQCDAGQGWDEIEFNCVECEVNEYGRDGKW